jgi:hypothetical protein
MARRQEFSPGHIVAMTNPTISLLETFPADLRPFESFELIVDPFVY